MFGNPNPPKAFVFAAREGKGYDVALHLDQATVEHRQFRRRRCSVADRSNLDWLAVRAPPLANWAVVRRCRPWLHRYDSASETGFFHWRSAAIWARPPESERA